MRILVDGDATPQINDIARIAQIYHKQLYVYCDYSHILSSDDYQTIICDQGNDSVDQKIVDDVVKGDLVITQDYGLASYVLLKEAYVLHVSGQMINENNINELLMQRYIGVINRKKDKHIKGPKKRTKETQDYFIKQLENIIKGDYL